MLIIWIKLRKEVLNEFKHNLEDIGLEKLWKKKFEFLYAFTVNKKPKEVDESRRW